MPDPTADAEREFAIAVRAVVHRLRRLGERRLGIEEIRLSEVDVLVHVIDHPGCTLTEVARALGLQPSNASATVRDLVGRGLLTRQTDPEDARRRLLRATPTAVQDRRRIDEAWVAAIGAFLAELPPAERRAALGAVPALRRLADLELAPTGQGEPADLRP
ncbi:MarR family winged helix-turn-helix transcriptional regulator [Actinotalea sp. M2MS4P-6]|uniref:MarR family winged helix-turn-helix transcriptional regulator n=1 Tax=Actinotalea sp. M2MS4P-6 TaxID=2983762 RepID=UPI0021E440DE|nr:MarR family winged helix-turn-helix transcriptional regulator [Actinotalea sp. M2MS4P-6]MCV2394340.1 MarR family winged helix-turn-helix transcriptional regulator [Actinotalea sp. M2MS4P-6]